MAPRAAGAAAPWPSLLLVLAFLVPVLPWTVRNYIVLDRFVPLSTGGGKALYVGSYLPADGDYQRVKAILAERYLGRDLEPGSAALDRVNPVPLFDRVAARYPDLPRDTALGKIGKQNLRDDITDHPLDYAAMLARKVGRMWGTGVGPAMEQPGGPGRPAPAACPSAWPGWRCSPGGGAGRRSPSRSRSRRSPRSAPSASPPTAATRSS